MTTLPASTLRLLAALMLVGCAPAVDPPAAPSLPAEEPRPAADTVERQPEPQPEPPTPPAPVLPRDPSARAAQLGAAVMDIVRTPPLDRTHWGIAIYDPAASRLLVDIESEKHFIPASNNKLLVAAAALARLGPEFRYQTRVQALGRRDGDRAAGLLVVGSGDPSMSARFFDSELAVLDSIAARVHASGLRHIDGPLVIDASRFDSIRVHPAWEFGDLDWYYAAPVAAFGVSEAAIPVRIAPTDRVGAPARVEFLGPTGLIAIINALRTSADTAAAWSVRRTPGDTLHFSGTIQLGTAPDTQWIAVHDPAAYAGRALILALHARGIRSDGDLRVLYDSAQAASVRAAVVEPPLVIWQSPPLREIVRGFLEPSQNWITEQVIKTLGAAATGRGSWDTGTRAVTEFLTRDVGIDTLAVRMRDGSGLSAQNLVTPGALVRLLAHARAASWNRAFRSALAAPGETDSTLRSRLLDYSERVVAKTGTITNVNSLSGFVITAGGRELVFSILSNATGLRSTPVQRAIDSIVELTAGRP
ncbi:MAG: D-alanyl-D-alanine carboxypeptidase/D-alanyl-D-alanine endopeptidase [Longimicrobiales bacterium]